MSGGSYQYLNVKKMKAIIAVSQTDSMCCLMSKNADYKEV